MKAIQINNYLIGAQHRPLIIAEMSGNHNHSLDRAWRLSMRPQRLGCRH